MFIHINKILVTNVINLLLMHIGDENVKISRELLIKPYISQQQTKKGSPVQSSNHIVNQVSSKGPANIVGTSLVLKAGSPPSYCQQPCLSSSELSLL